MQRWLLTLALATVAACAFDDGYFDPDGPRYAGDYTRQPPELRDRLRIVSYNLAFGRDVAAAVAALDSEPLRGADAILMQELDPDSADRLAEALELRYVYYPASVKHGGDFGNAVFTPWPITSDHKVLLPHLDPYSGTNRIAVAAELELGGAGVVVYSAHTETPTLGLGARLDQVEAMLIDAAQTTGAVVIGGDLNTSDPGSTEQTTALFADHGFVRASTDASDTGRGPLGTEFTLDHVFVRELDPLESGTYQGDSGSDHQPIWAEVSLP